MVQSLWGQQNCCATSEKEIHKIWKVGGIIYRKRETPLYYVDFQQNYRIHQNNMKYSLGSYWVRESYRYMSPSKNKQNCPELARRKKWNTLKRFDTKIYDTYGLIKHKDSEELRNSVQKRSIYNVSLYFTFNLNITKTILAETLLFTNPCECRQMKIIFIDGVTGYCGNFSSVFIHQLFIQQKNCRFCLFWNSKSVAVNCDWQILSAAAWGISNTVRFT